MFLSVAPSAPSMPSERSRRCASTVKPPTATSAMSSMPTVASASTIVSGLSGLLATAPCRVTTYLAEGADCGAERAARRGEQHGDLAWLC